MIVPTQSRYGIGQSRIKRSPPTKQAGFAVFSGTAPSGPLVGGVRLADEMDFTIPSLFLPCDRGVGLGDCSQTGLQSHGCFGLALCVDYGTRVISFPTASRILGNGVGEDFEEVGSGFLASPNARSALHARNGVAQE